MNVARLEYITLTLTSATGSGQTDLPVNGRLKAIHVQYGNGIPAATHVTIKCLDPDITLLTLANNNTSNWYFVRHHAASTTGGNVGEEHVEFTLWGIVQADVIDAAAGVITITLLIEHIQ